MKGRTRGWFLCLALAVLPAPLAAQATPADPFPLRLFPAFRGTWMLDAGAGRGGILGLPVARTVTISTTPTAISLVKDSGLPEVYPFDGTETTIRDPRTGVELDRRYSFVLVAETLALTSKLTRRGENGQASTTTTTIITDAYSVAGDVLTVEQLSVLVQPPGALKTLGDPGNNRQTIVYRRNVPAPAR